MNTKKMAVVEDMEAFLAWLATTPFVLSAANKQDRNGTQGPGKPAAAPGPDADLLAALKSMA